MATKIGCVEFDVYNDVLAIQGGIGLKSVFHNNHYIVTLDLDKLVLARPDVVKSHYIILKVQQRLTENSEEGLKGSLVWKDMTMNFSACLTRSQKKSILQKYPSAWILRKQY